MAVTAVAFMALGGVLVAVVWGVGQALAILGPVLWPLAVAGIISYLLDPLVDQLVSRRIPRARAIIVVFVGALLLVAGLAASVLPQLYKETKQFAERVPVYSSRIQHQLDDWMANPPAILQQVLGMVGGGHNTNAPVTSPLLPEVKPINNVPAPPPELVAVETNSPTGLADYITLSMDRGTLKSATTWLADTLPKVGRWMLGKVSKVASWFGILAGLALIPVYAFYFLLEKRGIERRWTDYLPVRNSEFKDEMVFVLRSINDYLIVFFRSQLLVAVCDGALYTIGFLLIGLPYSILLGVMATFLTMIPFLGAMATCAAALIIAFVQYGDWMHPAMVLVVFGVVQTLEGLVISPKIMGDRVGLHPLTIIVSVMVGTTLLGGILGGILAIPLTAALRVLMFRYVWKQPKGTTG